MLKNFSYRLVGFEAPEKKESGMWGFEVWLDGDFARLALEYELPQEIYVRLNETAENIVMVEGLKQKGEKIVPPYSFVSSPKGNLTALLQSIRIPGNSCDLGMDINSIGDIRKEKKTSLKGVIYSPHNVDNRIQRDALLSLWIRWNESAEAVLK